MDSFAKALTDKIDRELGVTFHNLIKRIRVVPEVEKFRWREDESVWEQKRDKTAKNYEVYMDGEFVCFVMETDGEQKAYLRTLEGIRDLYNQGKLFVNESMYKIKEAEAEEKARKAKEIEMPKPTTPEEKIVAGAIEKMAKKKGKKVKHV